MTTGEVMRPQEVADYMLVHRNTLQRIPWEQLPYFVINDRGDRRYRLEDVQAYIQAKTDRHVRFPGDLLG